jgi:hypothetical protein
MSKIDLLSALTIILIVHFSLCFVISKEINKQKNIHKRIKMIWHIFVWCIPILGGALANLYFKIAKTSSGTSSNGPYI